MRHIITITIPTTSNGNWITIQQNSQIITGTQAAKLSGTIGQFADDAWNATENGQTQRHFALDDANANMLNSLLNKAGLSDKFTGMPNPQGTVEIVLA